MLKQTYIAKTLFGLEKILAEEITNLGATNVQILRRAVSFSGDEILLIKANLYLRTAIKILKPIHEFRARNEHFLYKGVQQVNWSEFLSTSQTFAVESVVNSEFFNHSQFVALKTKDAIVDQFRKLTGVRPSVDTQRPDLSINIHIANETCTISIDSTGIPLNRRGYRPGGHPAPLNENLAAGMILMSGYNGDKPFVDGMCGSGTLLIEAALIAANIAPGLHRNYFSFMNWKNYDSKVFENLRKEAQKSIKKIEFPITGCDISAKAIGLAKENIDRSLVPNDKIAVIQKDFSDFNPPQGPGTIIMNPPYGERLSLEDSITFYKKIGDGLKANFNNYDAWIISGNIQAIKQIGLKTSERHDLLNGSIECKFYKYQMYMGSKKDKRN
ncbi:MAG: RNA methyltransferase [Bacteroidales bacterium]|nr:RNA methyltransferase [Bacteroidales bacterium]